MLYDFRNDGVMYGIPSTPLVIDQGKDANEIRVRFLDATGETVKCKFYSLGMSSDDIQLKAMQLAYGKGLRGTVDVKMSLFQQG